MQTNKAAVLSYGVLATKGDEEEDFTEGKRRTTMETAATYQEGRGWGYGIGEGRGGGGGSGDGG